MGFCDPPEKKQNTGATSTILWVNRNSLRYCVSQWLEPRRTRISYSSSGKAKNTKSLFVISGILAVYGKANHGNNVSGILLLQGKLRTLVASTQILRAYASQPQFPFEGLSICYTHQPYGVSSNANANANAHCPTLKDADAKVELELRYHIWYEYSTNNTTPVTCPRLKRLRWRWYQCYLIKQASVEVVEAWHGMPSLLATKLANVNFQVLEGEHIYAHNCHNM